MTIGEGATSEGEFWEALNSAATLKLPVVFVVEDNGYAISVPVEVNTPGGSISRLVRSYPSLFVVEVDGCDYLASYDAFRYAFAYARERKGPALVHGHVVRPYSHSLSDDEKLYRPENERQKDAERDPIVALREVPPRRGPRDGGRDQGPPRRDRRRGGPRRRRGAREPAARPRSPSSRTSTPRTSTRRRAAFDTEDAPAFSGEPDDDGRPRQRGAPGRDGARRADRRVGRGRRGREPRRRPRRVQGQGRRLQGHRGPPEGLRERARLQLAARRGEHRRPRDRLGRARPQARRRDPVLRLHLARDAAAARRARDGALALGRRVEGPRRRPRRRSAATSRAAGRTTRSPAR